VRRQDQAIVTIIIPCWRRSDLLRLCLESVAAQTERRFRVLVISNGGGEPVAAVAREFAGCELIELAENQGFAAGVNAGLDAAGTEYIAVLNDDVRLDPDWLAVLTGWLDEHPETGFCAGAIYSDDGERVDNLGDALSTGGAAWRLGHGLPASAVVDPLPRPLLAASWTAVVLRRGTIEAVGKLDEQFISYLEDVDFAVRCVRAGVQGTLLPKVSSRHHGSASSGGEHSAYAFRQLTRNRKLLLAKTLPQELKLDYGTERSIAGKLWLGMAFRQGKVSAWLAGQLDYWAILPRAWRERLKWDAESMARLKQWLRDGDAAIYADQFGAQRPAPDRFWRLYFALAGKPSAAPAQPGSSGQISQSSARHS
jgi:GT2 family glycosyltransferase